MNSLDPEVADPLALSASSSANGGVVADWANYGVTVHSLRALDSDETLLVRCGKPEGTFRTRADASRVVVVDSGPGPSWLNIGQQGFLPEACEFIAAAAREHFGGVLAGKLIGSSSLSGALPLAATMNGAAFLGIDADAERVKRRVKAGYCDVMVNDLDEALRILKNAVRKGEAASVGLARDPTEVIPEMAGRGVVPDIFIGAAGPDVRVVEALESLKGYGAAIVAPERLTGGRGRTLLCVALSGEPADIQRVDRLMLELFSTNEKLCRWIKAVKNRVRHQGLPARACSLGSAERRVFGAAVNELVARNDVKAPIVIARDGLNTRAGDSDAVSAEEAVDVASLLDAAAGADWAAIRPAHSEKSVAKIMALAVVADGTTDASARIERMLVAGEPL